MTGLMKHIRAELSKDPDWNLLLPETQDTIQNDAQAVIAKPTHIVFFGDTFIARYTIAASELHKEIVMRGRDDEWVKRNLALCMLRLQLRLLLPSLTSYFNYCNQNRITVKCYFYFDNE